MPPDRIPVHDLDTLLDRYLAGEASPDESATIHHLIANRPGASEAFSDILDTITTSGAEPPDVSRTWERMRQRIDSDGLPRLDLGRRNRRPLTARISGAWLAFVMVIMVAGAGVFAWNIQPTGSTNETTSYTTRRAQQAHFDLPDGSRVVLGPESQLEYEVNANGQRMVALVGQAYFSVSPDAKRPFVVMAGGVPAHVLGTSFVVRAYATDSAVQVAVVEGKVAVGEQEQSAILLAGDMTHAAPGVTPEISHMTSVADVIGWTRGQTVFEYVAFKDAIPELERAYDVQIEAGDSVVANRLLRVVLTSPTPAALVQTLEMVLDASSERRGETIVFQAR